MRSLVLIAASIVSFAATAAVVKVVNVTDGSQVQIHDTNGHCTGGERLVEWIAPDMSSKILGCWTVVGGGRLMVTFADGRIYGIPFAALEDPKTL